MLPIRPRIEFQDVLLAIGMSCRNDEVALPCLRITFLKEHFPPWVGFPDAGILTVSTPQRFDDIPNIMFVIWRTIMYSAEVFNIKVSSAAWRQLREGLSKIVVCNCGVKFGDLCKCRPCDPATEKRFAKEIPEL